MVEHRHIRAWPYPCGIGTGISLVLACMLLVAPIALANDDKDDEPVGWPLKREDKVQMDRAFQREQAAPLPERSEVTDTALAAWPGNERTTTPDDTATLAMTPLPSEKIDAIDLPVDNSSAAAPAQIASSGIAALKRFTPPVRHELIVYAPGDFSIGAGTAERLGQMAVRLRGTRDRISIIAHSGDAQISTHEAVKLSFKRAMLVRLYLIEEGVSPDQIDLEALPQANDGGPAERVNISATSKTARR